MLYIGTSGWSYPTWKPAFFPQQLPAKRFLEFYSTRLNAVELNGTFKRMPAANVIQGWIAAAAPGFRFAAKAHQSITHFKRLKEADESVRFFLRSLEPMRESGKLGPVLFQLPPNLKADTGLLDAFVRVLPLAYKFAFEFRHESWFADPVYEILKKKNAALCWAESEKIVVPRVATADFVYYRFREPEYSTPDLEKVAADLKDQSAEREVYAFFKHEEQPESALNAQKVARACGIEERPFVMPEKKRAGKKPVS